MKSEKISIFKVLTIAFGAAALAACGGSGNSNDRNATLAAYADGKGAQTSTVNRYLMGRVARNP